MAPNIKVLQKDSLRLLGSPILDESFGPFIDETLKNFKFVSDRIIQLNSHMAFVIIRFYLFAPKFMYSVRSSPFWKHPNLTSKLDDSIQNLLCELLNISMDARTWAQASLPIRFGGLGIRQITNVALPAFLASTFKTSVLTRKILDKAGIDSPILYQSDAIEAWKGLTLTSELPASPSSQRLWDEPLCRLARDNLLHTSTSSANRARLLAVAEWESGLWLQSLPSVKLGTFLDNPAFRLAISLRLGTPCNVPHRCPCGEMVDALGHHGLSCSRSAGRIPRHSNLNDIIRRALASASVPAVLEPNGLVRSDGKRPDGMTLVPWKMGRPLVWDATCVDTLAPSHLPRTSSEVGAAAVSAESHKRRKYAGLSNAYVFEPFAVETLGPWGPGAHRLYRELAKRLTECSGDQRAGVFLGQRISLAIQRGNTASLLGTLPLGSDLGHIFYL